MQGLFTKVRQFAVEAREGAEAAAELIRKEAKERAEKMREMLNSDNVREIFFDSLTCFERR